MQFVRTMGWLACVVYSTVPLFWLMVHLRAHRWRKRERSPFRVLLPAWVTMWVGIAALTGPWRNVTLYSTAWSWIPAGILYAIGIVIYIRVGPHFSWAQLGGLPEVRTGHQGDRLITTGIRARVRHPVYLAHLCEMLAWSIGTGLLVCWRLSGFAVATGAVMIRMEDAELEKRFGEEYRRYRSQVPALLPNPTAPRVRPRVLCDGITIRYEAGDRAIWQISIADIIRIGEYTNPGGPWIDDYFLVFEVKDGLWYEASFYDDGAHQAVEVLSKTLGCELGFGLVQSTKFMSRVMWPKEFEGQPFILDKSANPEVKRHAGSRQL